MSNNDVKELKKKETSIIEKYIKLKAEEKKNKENIEDLKDDVLKILKEHEGKVVHNGYWQIFISNLLIALISLHSL